MSDSNGAAFLKNTQMALHCKSAATGSWMVGAAPAKS
jgi:hypothetical protein